MTEPDVAVLNEATLVILRRVRRRQRLNLVLFLVSISLTSFVLANAVGARVGVFGGHDCPDGTRYGVHDMRSGAFHCLKPDETPDPREDATQT